MIKKIIKFVKKLSRDTAGEDFCKMINYKYHDNRRLFLLEAIREIFWIAIGLAGFVIALLVIVLA